MITEQPEQTREAWNNLAAGYDEFVTPSHMWLANEGLRRIELRQNMKFLDVACGSGALSIPAARLGAQVLSVDLSPKMITQLKERAQKEGLKLEALVMDGHSLELQDNAFDVAGSQFGVMLFPDMPRALREMVRVTKPNGKVLMNVYGSPQKIEFLGFFVNAIQSVVPGFNPPMDPPPLPFQLQDPEKLRHEMIEAGLRDVFVETVTEKLEFNSGKHLWNWLINSNPIAEQILLDLKLSQQNMDVIKQTLDQKVHDRSQNSGTAVLTNPINIGVGRK
jgi:ubiquinone/menaquinone biosynthesis C-methylase UbiE